MNRIICVGNRYVPGDDIGPRVFDLLSVQELEGQLPHDLEVYDGALAGLDLLYLMEEADRVVFVDGILGFRGDKSPEIVVLSAQEVVEQCVAPAHHGHAGLLFALRCLDACTKAPREVFVVGIESSRASEESIAKRRRVHGRDCRRLGSRTRRK